MAVNNYQNPGVYVTQVASPALTSANNTSLNICILAYPGTNIPVAPQTDRFLLSSGVSAPMSFNLTQSGVVTAGLVVTNNTTGAPLVANTDYVVATVSNVTTITTITGGAGIAGVGTNGWIAANYNYTTAVSGATYTFYNFDGVQNTFGPAFAFNSTTGAVTINSPATLAAYLAFQNGAQIVSCQNIIAPNSGSNQDFLDAIQGLVTIPGINVIVPLKYDTDYNTTTSGILFTGLSNFLIAQASNGVYQCAFVGMDSTVTSTNLINTVAKIASNISSGSNTNGTRMSLAVPQQINVNPGLNSTTGISTGFVTIDGFYLAAALAGLFVGQPDVYIPITHKIINGVQSIPSQVSASDSTTIQSLGGCIVRQRANGQIYVRHGLTLNTTNWLTQEISINAIGDRLSNNIANALESSTLIGSALTSTNLASLQSIVLATLMRSVNTNLIQSYQSLSYSVNPATPTTVNVSFQYSPTYPLNYVQVSLSINAQSGTITSVSNTGATNVS